MNWQPGVVTFLLGLLMSSPGVAQQDKRIRLPPETGRISERFVSVAAIRELRDGRVLVADARERRVVIADFGRNVVSVVGRRGGSAGEYSATRSLFPLRGDSSLFVDRAAGRWLIMSGTAFVRTTPADAELVRQHALGVLGTDTLDNVWRLGLVATQSFPRQLLTADSVPVIKTGIASGEVDTITYLRAAPTCALPPSNRSGVVAMSSALSVGEQGVVFPDGWLAVARLHPYRLQIFDGQGKLRRSIVLPFARLPITAREREAFVKRARSSVADADTLKRPFPSFSERVRMLFVKVPDEYPPFTNNSMIAASDGTLLIRKPETADLPQVRYDVVDRNKGFLGTLVMPDGETIVGFGEVSAYMVWKDAEDMQHIRRHRWSR